MSFETETARLRRCLKTVAGTYGAHKGKGELDAIMEVSKSMHVMAFVGGTAPIKSDAYDRTVQAFSNTWPDDLAWPDSVARPAKEAASAAA